MDQQGAEAFEQGDEAFDEAARLDPMFIEAVEIDPSIDSWSSSTRRSSMRQARSWTTPSRSRRCASASMTPTASVDRR